ncbi:hypothetical protein BGZ60DRAFT_363553 [Tricladium varicosporioides]|nr:hypothetical protein BGZ60DRAFT_363553 [Hymenoscyphus varicosporioides]
MQFTNILSLASLLALTSAAPTACGTNGCAGGVIVFHGAAGAQYTLTVPLDGQEHATNNVLSISSVSSDTIDVAKQCTLKTVDYTPALVEGPAHTWAVGPPQQVLSIKCGAGQPVDPTTYIDIEFQGADPDKGAKYSVHVPLTGATIPTNNALSISTVVSTFAALPTNCHFDYVDYQAALVLIAPNKWAVGPPQQIRSVSCHA